MFYYLSIIEVVEAKITTDVFLNHTFLVHFVQVIYMALPSNDHWLSEFNVEYIIQ